MASCHKPDPGIDDNLLIREVIVTHHEQLSMTIWEISVEGKAGATTPTPVGQLHTAPVLGYVFSN